MNTPPFLTGAVLIFWGWQTGLLIPGIIAAIVIEMHRFISRRIEIDDIGFSRVVTLCNIFLVISVVFAYASMGSANAFLSVIEWFPLILFPLVAAQLYSVKGSVNPDIFFIFLNTSKLGGSNKGAKTISIIYPYIVLSIVSGSLANMRSLSVYVLMAILCGWTLYSVKPARSSLATWMPLFLIAAFAGYLGSIGLNRLHGKVEDKFIEWYAGTLSGKTDSQRTTTAIGQIGSRKSSGKIVLRVKGDSQMVGSFHLAQSSYDVYRDSSWYATLSPMKAIQSERDGTSWKLVDDKEITNEMTIFMEHEGEKSFLALPANALMLEVLPVENVRRNRFGTVAIENDPLFTAYTVKSGDTFLSGPPTERDSDIPKKVSKVIMKIATKLDLQSKSPDQALATVEGFFMNSFEYSLEFSDASQSAKSLEDFLLKSKSGHCEYFATSTVLLLRAAGIPARYTVGYLCQ